MKIDDFTYEHQIISQAKYLLKKEKNNKIDGVQLDPKTILSMKIFAHLIHSGKALSSTSRFGDLKQIIDDYINSSLTQDKLSKFCNKMKGNLDKINTDGVAIRDILDQVEFLILLSFMNKESSLKFMDQTLVDNLIQKLNFIKDFSDFLFLLNTYNNEYEEDTFPSSPIQNIIVESLLELKVNEIIQPKNISRDFYKKLKVRKLYFIKEVYDKLDLFKNDSVFKPSSQVIYEVFMSASVLILLSYDNIISLDKYESEAYLDKDIDERMVESEIVNRIKDIRKEILEFTIPLTQITQIFKKRTTPLFYLILVYIIFWVIFSIFLYLREVSGGLFYGVLVSLLIFTASILKESFEKSLSKN